MTPDKNTKAYRNQLLSALSAKDVALLEPHLKPVVLALRDNFELPNRPIKNVFFPEAGIISVVASGARRKQLEIGIIGREGMSGLMVILGDDRSPYSSYCQIAGNGHSLPTDALRAAMRESPELAAFLLRYAQTFVIQTAQTALTNGSAKLEERLARWLLMAHDRIDGDELPLIHDFLALMLGVRRPGVTVALHSLEQRGLIRPFRGSIAVLDRKGLEEVANASYGLAESEYKWRMTSSASA
jgi:CRP-like cAMP-binding protein